MADDRNYRVQIRYDADADEFIASVPELDLTATAPNRADTIEAIEAEIDARMQAAAEGDPLPPPADQREVDGALELEISPQLHRDLIFHAERSKMSVEALACELLARGIGTLEGKSAAAPQPEYQPEDDRPRRGRRRNREGYRPELDDKDNFRDYLRRMERGGGGGGGGRGRR